MAPHDIICTDMSEAELIYTARITDTTRFDPSFATALVLHVHAHRHPAAWEARHRPGDAGWATPVACVRLRRRACARGHFTENDGEFVRSRYA